MIATSRVAKEFFRFLATSERQLLGTWLRIKNRVLEHFFRVMLFDDTRSSDSRYLEPNQLSMTGRFAKIVNG